MAEDSKIHTGHRRRMRSRVAENGFSSLEPHEALECLLYITNARKNTNRMAHELIDRFGDFAGVLDASEEDLMTVEGVGPATARMLHLMPDVCRYYTQCRTGRNGCLKTTEQLAEHLMGLFAGAALQGCRHHVFDGKAHPVAGAVLEPERRPDPAAAVQRHQQGPFPVCPQEFTF